MDPDQIKQILQVLNSVPQTAPVVAAINAVRGLNQPATTTAVPPAVDIAPPGSAAAAITTPATTTTTTAGPPNQTTGIGNPEVDKITLQSRTQLAAANAEVERVWGEIKPLQQKYNDILAANKPLDMAPGGLASQVAGQLNSLFSDLARVEGTVESANAAYSNALNQAIKTTTLDPATADLYRKQADQADATAAEARARAKVLTERADSQKQLTAAQAGAQVEQGKLDAANAELARAKAG